MGPRYTLRQLGYFITAAEEGTVIGAADKLFMTQSAMSAALTDLEKALGTQLFVRRRGRGLELTPGGLAFLPHARRLLREADDLDDLAKSLQDSLSGTLSVGCFDAMAPAILTPFATRFRRTHPEVELKIRPDSQNTLVDNLLTGELELALLYDFELPAELSVDTVVESVGHVLLPVDHPLATQETVSLSDLKDTPLIAITTPPARALAQAFRLSGIELTPHQELGNFDLIRSLVQAGFGYTIFAQPLGGLPPHWGSKVMAVPIAETLPPLTIALVHRNGVRLTRRAEAFRSLCMSEGQELLSYPRPKPTG